MTKLASVYARSTGLKLDPRGPNIKKAFYPLPFTRYITIQTGSNHPAKNYDYFAEALNLIRPMLAVNNIGIVLLGFPNDPALPGVHDLRGRTNEQQVNYLISNSLCHIGTDSFLAHCAGWNKRPLVVLFGSTNEHNHGPYWRDPTKTIVLESHRGGGVPTYTLQEHPKTINWIPPEQVANSVLKLLGIEHEFTHQSRFFGPIYGQAMIDVVPNTCPPANFAPEMPVTVRLDYIHNEDILVQTLKAGRKVNVVTTRSINPAILQMFKGSILSYNHELGAAGTELPTNDYMAIARTLCPKHVFFTRCSDDKQVADIRFKYLDLCTVDIAKDPTREDYFKSALEYLNKPDTPENRIDLETELKHTNGRLRFKSTKYLLSEGKCYLSFAHQQADQPIPSPDANIGDVIDSPAFFRDLNYMTFFYEPARE